MDIIQNIKVSYLLIYAVLFLGFSTVNFNTKLHGWIPDNGDGTYKNPVIFADYSDPDVIRVGNDFYLTSSSFSNVPGLPILHSNDLVNWKIINHAVSEIPFDKFSFPQQGNGIWAPSIRFHNGEFLIYYGDPDRGIFLVKTKNPFGKWEKPICVIEAKGWIDPCPLWDDDGNVYLVHAWAKSRAGFNSVLTVNKLSRDGTKILDDGITIFDGHKDQPTIEGPKFYKRNNFYYVFAPAGGVKPGWQVVLRSKNIYGPYESKIVLAQGNTKINGPHQGAWVETQNGESWFIHFQDRGAFGRIVHLEPMKWTNDWPEIGINQNENGTGEPALTYKKPDVGKIFPIQIPQTSDEFDSLTLGLQWQWQANYKKEWYSLNLKPGYLILYCQSPSELEFINLWTAPNLLLQKFPAPEFSVTTSMVLNTSQNSTKAGLIIFGLDYSYLALEKVKRGYKIEQVLCRNAAKNKAELIIDSRNISQANIFLRVSVSADAICRFSYSEDNKTYFEIGKEFMAKEGKWVGAKVGLFSSARVNQDIKDYAAFDWFRFN